MSHDSTSEPINSGAIGHISYPGSESGLSLVQLIGTITANTSLSSITLRLTAGALVAAFAGAGSANTTARMRLGAATDATAATSVSARTKIQVFPEAGTASVSSFAGVLLKRRIAGSATAESATVAVGANTIVSRGAAANATALGQSDSKNRGFRGASATASALAQDAGSLRGISLAGSTDARAVNSAHSISKFRLLASSSGTATSTVFGLVAKTASAVVNAVATTSAYAIFYERINLLAQSALASTSANPRSVFSFGATTDAKADIKIAGVFLQYSLGATTSTQVNTSTAAADYSVTIPAPVERVMVVLASNRRMEVTE